MKKTLKSQVIELLMGGWYSNYQINMKLKSSSADREMRRVRKFPPLGYMVVSRNKNIEGYRPCLEYTLKKVEASYV